LKQPLILEIKGNALDDGPGIRSVIFFKGCPLSCTWCHNPESKQTGMEIGFESETCVGCNACMGVCRENALSRENPFYIDRSVCTLCFQCIETCPSGALSKIGHPMDISQIVKKVVRDKPFYDTSGGGATLSGGEPTMFMDFCGHLLQALKGAGIHTLLETCGLFDLERFNQKIRPFLDVIYFDIKLMDPALHSRHCGVSNKTILSNFKALHEQAAMDGISVVPRLPLIPGITDTPENLHAIVNFLCECNVREAQLLPYHPLWQKKNLKIGVSAEPISPVLDTWLDSRILSNCRNLFSEAGIDTGK
jgi:pyruvate formate lyase activating enzyme